jgi:hypothetical protein
MIYASRLRFCELFFSMWSSVFVLYCFFPFSTRCCQYYMNYWIHSPFNCWQTSEDVERVKIPYQLHWVTYFCEMWSEEFIYRAFNWSVKNTFDEPWRGSPFFSSKVEEWLMMTFVMENCLLDLFVVLDLDLEPVWIDNSCLFFFVSQMLELNI